MTTFDEREQAFENRFAHDEELAFKAVTRRDHALGLWAATLLGKHGDDAEGYAQEVLATGIQGGGPKAVFERLRQDFAAGKVTCSDDQIRDEMVRLLAEARRQVLSQ